MHNRYVFSRKKIDKLGIEEAKIFIDKKSLIEIAKKEKTEKSALDLLKLEEITKEIVDKVEEIENKATLVYY